MKFQLSTWILLIALLLHGACKKETCCESFTESNEPPIAIAGADQAITLPIDSISLDGSASNDPDGTIVEWRWTKISGPVSSKINNASASKTVVRNFVAGSYQFELKVTDADGLLSADTVSIFVTTDHETQKGIWEIIITLPIDSVFIDDYYRDTEGYAVTRLSGPDAGIIEGAWVRKLVPGVYLFGRYINGSNTPEKIKVTVLDDPNQRNTITYKNLLWEYNHAWNLDGWFTHLFLSRPRWPGIVDHPVKIFLQMNFFNNGEWFNIPSNTGGLSFWSDCRGFNSLCMTFFVVKVDPENTGWAGKHGNVKIQVL